MSFVFSPALVAASRFGVPDVTSYETTLPELSPVCAPTRTFEPGAASRIGALYQSLSRPRVTSCCSLARSTEPMLPAAEPP